MYKFEIVNNISAEDNSIPKVELWMLSPVKMLVSPEYAIEYRSKEDFVKSYTFLNEKKIALEQLYIKKDGQTIDEFPKELKDELLTQIRNYLKSFDKSNIGLANSRKLK